MPTILANPHVRPGFTTETPSSRPAEFHRRLPGYRPTRLAAAAAVAGMLNLTGVYVKDESNRLGLSAYKVLGAAWATFRLLEREGGAAGREMPGLDDLRREAVRLGVTRLISATDGNHGRGVARVARWLGLGSEIFVPVGTAPARIAAIESEGATVTVVAGTYDETVSQAAGSLAPGDRLVQDHGWEGYQEIPDWVAEGYETILIEADEQLSGIGLRPTHVFCQIGVGTLASAVVRHYRRAGLEARPVLVGVEPTGAACMLRSIEAGHPVMLEVGAGASIMAGLNCGTPSLSAWPTVRDGMDLLVAVEDDLAREAMRRLWSEGIGSGESGAAGLAGLLALTREGAPEVRQAARLGPESVVLLLSTEGVTDPVSWERIVGSPPPV